MDLNGGIADMLEASRGGGRGGRVVRDHCFGYLDMPNVRKPISGSFTIDEAESRATLDASWNTGVRYYDTVPWQRPFGAPVGGS
jgi:aryl-alcohol dehydrogenase-like predicted oxidoreductase